MCGERFAFVFVLVESSDRFRQVGHPFALVYQAQIEFDVYSSLLDLANETSNELSDLDPRDRIDIQSLMWVVGNYREDREEVDP